MCAFYVLCIVIVRVQTSRGKAIGLSVHVCVFMYSVGRRLSTGTHYRPFPVQLSTIIGYGSARIYYMLYGIVSL